MVLKNLDYEVNVSHSIFDIEEKMGHCFPTMILVHTDELDEKNLKLIKNLKKNDKTSKIIVILICDNCSMDKILDGLRNGAEDYIESPFSEELIKIKLQNYLNWRANCNQVDDLNQLLADEKKEIQEERDILAKYFSRDLIDAVLSGSIGSQIGGDIQTATIMFCDMRDSTTIAEQLDPAAFMDLVNNLFTDLTDIIYGEGGSVNKFIGDGILATFGCPQELEDETLHCANVALKIRKYLENFNQFRPDFIKDPMRIGIGISRGQVFSGNVGSVNQIQYTVLGDPVNIASRLESLSKRVGVDILIDGNVRDILGKNALVKRVNLTKVRGKLEQIRIFYLDSLK